MCVCVLLFHLTFRMCCCIRPQSCPPLRSYSDASDKLEEQLDAALSGFCNRGVKMDSDGRSLVVNSIFKWFRVDFAPNEAQALRSVTKTLPHLFFSTCQKSVHLFVNVVQVQTEYTRSIHNSITPSLGCIHS